MWSNNKALTGDEEPAEEPRVAGSPGLQAGWQVSAHQTAQVTSPVDKRQ